jgi:aldehyde dehydrogenase (NAD+)
MCCIDGGISELVPSPDPLVVYVFSQDENFKKRVFEQTRAGAFVVNETVIHPGGSFLRFMHPHQR